MTAVHDRYIAALRYRALTHFYDPVVALTTREATFKAALVEQVALRPGDQVLDLGCGTGTLTLLLKQGPPAADLVGLDGDLEVLALGR